MSNKKPSELAAWNNDKTMVMHAHKPGVSQKISIQEIIDAVPAPELPEQLDVSEKGKELVALETVAEMKALLEVPEASEGGDELLVQSSDNDSTENALLKVGAFGLGKKGSNLELSTFNWDSASAQPTGFYQFKGTISGTQPPGLAPTTSTLSALFNFNPTSSKEALFQITLNNRNYDGIWIRRSQSGTGYRWTDWKDLLASHAPLENEVGSLRLAYVLDPTRGTLAGHGMYTDFQPRYLGEVGFDGVTRREYPSHRMSGTWAQVTWCDHMSEDPMSRIALWRRIA